MVKKIKLKKVSLERNKMDIFKNIKLFDSGFCLTDNNNFAFFKVLDDFFLDNKIKIHKIDFEFREEDLQMLIDRKKIIKPEIKEDKIYFPDYGYVDKKLIDLFSGIKYVFVPVTEWFNQQSNRLVAILLNDTFGKPIGVLKTFEKEIL